MTSRAIITGASRGLGLLTAQHLRKSGWRVGMIARTSPADTEWSEHSIDSFFTTGDVADAQDMIRCAEMTNESLGNARLLVCNAAVLGPVGQLHETNAIEFQHTFAVNVLGVINTIKAYWTQLRDIGDARVIVVSGGGAGGPRPMLRAPAYVPSKSALASLVEVLAPEFADIGAAITAVAPGAVLPTDFLSSVTDATVETAGAQLVAEAAMQRSAPSNGADGYLRLLEYLAGPQGKYLNGATLSGKWNTPEQLDAVLQRGLSPSMYRLRRIDGDLYDER